jgi:hypothetical protein
MKKHWTDGLISDRRKTRPNLVHPTVPGAVGSMESPYREGRDTAEESRLIIEDTIRNVREIIRDEGK